MTQRGYKKLSKSSPLSAKMRKFVEEYVVDYNATRAAEAAGYKNPKHLGSKLLKHRDVAMALKVRETHSQKKNELKKQRIIEELALCVLRDPVDLVDSKGNFHSDIRKIPEHLRRCIDKFEVEQFIDKKTGKIIQKIKVGLTSKLAAIDMAMRHKGLFAPTEQNHTVRASLNWDELMAAGRKIATGVDDPVEKRIQNPTAPPSKVIDLPKADYTVTELLDEEDGEEDELEEDE